ncbi:MAG TPA: xanthine phosphoribosyltransferase [Acidimicrobiia bacterium]|nr:xanthine phosphoribosyltransferase [Acidimicrobiia bacterium]
MDLNAIVQSRARVDGNLILVDDFLNHRVEPAVMRSAGEGLAAAIEAHRPTLLLTAEASGIPPAVACGLVMDLPVVYAKKYLGTGDRYSYAREVTSPTKRVEYRVEVARRVLGPGERVAVVDDILAQGRTAEALGEIIEEAGSDVEVFAFVLEKCFMSGRERLEAHGWPVAALVEVDSLDRGAVNLRPPR